MTETTPAGRYQAWLNERAAGLRRGDRPPASAAEARRRAGSIRRRMREAAGEALIAARDRAPLDPQVLGAIERDGYRIERLLFQTRPGTYATANVYVPTSGRGPFPAVLCVHGHFSGARRDPVVQSRCIGLARLGFVALALDAWGAGERGTVPGRNEYHGGLLGASLWPVGTPLNGMQLNDNTRALDYLQSRPDVDGSRLGCTGASGGGNQTTHFSALDERIRCAVPVCSVGTFASYLTAACCVDEVLVGALGFAEQGDLLGMVAPRALMVITASRDVYHFGPDVARQALERARPYFRAHDAEDRVRHVVIESGHDYSRPMREAMYGWMRRWLMDEGDGSPVPEPPIRTEDPADLACFPPMERPPKVTTTVAFVHARARKLAEGFRPPASPGEWRKTRGERARALRQILRLPKGEEGGGEAGSPPPGPFFRVLYGGEHARPDLALLLHPGGEEAAAAAGVAAALRGARVAAVAVGLAGCGDLTLARQALGNGIPDHNLVEWSLWIDRPLLGQWVESVARVLEREEIRRLGGRKAVVIGWREAGLAALAAAVLDDRIAAAAAIEAPASLISPTVPHNQRMAVFQPDLLRAGDIPQLAALPAPRRVLVANPLKLDGSAAAAPEVEALYGWSRRTYAALGEAHGFLAGAGMADAEIADTLRGWLEG